ncbi:unnamed protein product, partial [Prorocentrum cordatum]
MPVSEELERLRRDTAKGKQGIYGMLTPDQRRAQVSSRTRWSKPEKREGHLGDLQEQLTCLLADGVGVYHLSFVVRIRPQVLDISKDCNRCLDSTAAKYRLGNLMQGLDPKSKHTARMPPGACRDASPRARSPPQCAGAPAAASGRGAARAPRTPLRRAHSPDVGDSRGATFHTPMPGAAAACHAPPLPPEGCLSPAFRTPLPAHAAASMVDAGPASLGPAWARSGFEPTPSPPPLPPPPPPA